MGFRSAKRRRGVKPTRNNALLDSKPSLQLFDQRLIISYYRTVLIANPNVPRGLLAPFFPVFVGRRAKENALYRYLTPRPLV